MQFKFLFRQWEATRLDLLEKSRSQQLRQRVASTNNVSTEDLLTKMKKFRDGEVETEANEDEEDLPIVEEAPPEGKWKLARIYQLDSTEKSGRRALEEDLWVGVSLISRGFSSPLNATLSLLSARMRRRKSLMLPFTSGVAP